MAGFDLVNVSDTSPLVKMFKKQMETASKQLITAFIPQKMKKIAGEAVKDLDFVLENGQIVTLVVRSDGDVVRVKINGKETPLKSELFHFSADSFQLIQKTGGFGLQRDASDKNSAMSVFSKAVAEIAERVQKNQPAFDKRRSAEKVRVPPTNTQKKATSIVAQTKQIKASIEELDKEKIDKTAQRDELLARLETKQVQQSQLYS